MKKIIFILVLLLSIANILFADVNLTLAKSTAETFLNNSQVNTKSNVLGQLISEEDNFYIFNLIPQGFIIISKSKELEPVIGYSFENNFINTKVNYNTLTSIINNSQILLKQNLSYTDKLENMQRWDNFNTRNDEFQQWPPADQTTTGGWVQTRWHQDSPYNDMCPTDPSTGNRSVAGCPSISVSQILNFHKQINNTQFDISDRFHSFTASNNNYYIDDTHNTHDYPDFTTLNTYLNEISNLYNSGEALNNQQKAALVFASGIAVKQAYSSSISGNYFSIQILNAYHRFGFINAELLNADSPFVNERIIDNMKNALPAQLSLLTPQGSGHQVVIDGYNTLNKLHLNFGWGGQSDGWYNFPLSAMPYQLNIFETVVLDINQNWQNSPNFEISIIENAENLIFEINTTDSQIVNYKFYINDNFQYQANSSGQHSISLSSYQTGIYTLKVFAFYESGSISVRNQNFEIQKGLVIFSQNFDQDFSDWSISGSNTGWQSNNSSFVSFSNICPENVNSALVPLAYSSVNSSLTSPEIHLPDAQNLNLSFYAAYSDVYLSYPNLKLFISSNNGNSWNLLWEAFNDNADWKWHLINTDITDYSGQSIQLKFVAQGFSYCDIAVDNLKILKDSFVNTTDTIISPISYLYLYPNPVRSSGSNTRSSGLNIKFNTEKSDNTIIQIFDIKGRKIREIHNDYLSKGQHNFQWNLQNSHGKKVSSGIYFIKVNSNNYNSINKVVVIK